MSRNIDKMSEEEIDILIKEQGGNPAEYIAASKDAVDSAIKFNQWFEELKKLARKYYNDKVVDEFCPEDWKEYYEEGDSPRDAILEDISNE